MLDPSILLLASMLEGLAIAALAILLFNYRSDNKLLRKLLDDCREEKKECELELEDCEFD